MGMWNDAEYIKITLSVAQLLVESIILLLFFLFVAAKCVYLYIFILDYMYGVRL